jgi:hypothetical protein
MSMGANDTCSNSSSIVLPNDVELYKEKNYGQSKILILRKK